MSEPAQEETGPGVVLPAGAPRPVEAWRSDAAKTELEDRRRKHDEWAARAEAEKEAAPPISRVVEGSIVNPRKGDDAVGFDWSTYAYEKGDPEPRARGLEMVVLGGIYRTVHWHGDRRPAAQGLSSTGNRSGIPGSEADLAPRKSWKSGVDSVLETTTDPDKWAENLIRRDDDEEARLDGTAGATLRKIREEGKDFRADEKEIRDALVYRLKGMFEDWIKKGWLELGAVVKWNDKDTGIGADKRPKFCRFTVAAVEAAEKRIPGTRYAKGAGSNFDGMTEKQKDLIRAEAPWYAKEAKDAKAGA